MKWVLMFCLESYTGETKCTEVKKKNAHFPVIKNAIKRIAFENAFESPIIFKFFLYANIPAEKCANFL